MLRNRAVFSSPIDPFLVSVEDLYWSLYCLSSEGEAFQIARHQLLVSLGGEIGEPADSEFFNHLPMEAYRDSFGISGKS